MGLRHVLFGNVLEKVITVILIILILVSIFIIIKNKIDLTKNEDRKLFLKSLGEFGVGAFKNLGKVTSYVIKQEWIPEVEEENKTNETKNTKNK